MRIESSVLTLSWIPSEAVQGISRLGFEAGPLHYDEPLPDALRGLDEVEELRRADRFRFGNLLRAWIEVEDGAIVGHGQEGGGIIGSTTLGTRAASVTFQGILLPELRPAPEAGDGWVTFRQTVGGCTGVPAPRPVRHKPFVQYRAPTVWTTLALTLHADGRSEWKLEGASGFPRHWVYDADLRLVAKSGTTDYKNWFANSFGDRTPWGDADSPALVAEVESALEREMSSHIMKGGKPKIRKLKEGAVVWEQGDEGSTVCLLLDGILEVIVDGEPVATVGPGALFGERAVIEGGTRTATLRATTKCRIAEARKVELDPDKLAAIAATHRRETQVR